MSAPFDPSEYSVRAATPKLTGLNNEELKALYDAELGGKHRTSLLSAISSALDSNLEEQEAVTEKVTVAPAPAKSNDTHINHSSFVKLPWHARKKWASVGGGKYKLIG